ncbi:GNAT family N-acetyltransferase [Sulfitobacter sp. LCG007]
MARPSDAGALGELFHRAIREGESPYTEPQRAAWSPELRGATYWEARICGQAVVLEEREGQVLGFMSLDPEGCIDLAFILPHARGVGLFRTLYGAIEERALALGLARLWTHASLMAEPAFRSVGFRVIQRETVDLAGQTLRRAEMEKMLA